MPKKRWIKIALPVLMLAGAIALFILLASGRPSPDRREPPQAAMLVDTLAAEPTDEHFTVMSQGTVRAKTRASMVAEVSGRIVEVSDKFVAGGFFKAEEVLARIDPSDYESELLRAQADLASAEARLSDERARSAQARRDWENLRDQGGREPSPLVLRIPQVQEAEASVQAAEAAVQRAERNLERTRIRLPYDGLIVRRETDLGQYVNTGTTLGEAFAVDVAEVRLPIPDRDLAYLDLPRPGFDPDKPVAVTLTGNVSGGFGTWEAWIVRTEAVVDESTRLTHAVARIEDPYALNGDNNETPLPMGTFVNARIRGRSAAGLIPLPRVALRDNGRIFIADENDKLAIREVDVVRSTPETVYVSNSLKPGDRVITTALQTPIPGLDLRVREAAGGNGTSEEPELRILPAGDDIPAEDGDS